MSKPIVVVTGANRGIGLEFVKQFLSKSFKVFAGCRKPGEAIELDTLAKNYPDELVIEELDVSSEASIRKFRKSFDRRYEHLDLLINNAGTNQGAWGESLGDLKWESFETSFRVNSIGPIFVTQSFLTALAKASDPKIVQISSQMGSIADNSSGSAYSYRMSKTALNMFNRSLAQELKNMTCLSLHPGWVQTDMGGKNARITTEESVKGMLHIISNASQKQSGQFLNYRGEKLPW